MTLRVQNRQAPTLSIEFPPSLWRPLPCFKDPTSGPGPASPSVGVPSSAQKSFQAAQTSRVSGPGRQMYGRRAIRKHQVGVSAAAQQLLHRPTGRWSEWTKTLAPHPAGPQAPALTAAPPPAALSVAAAPGQLQRPCHGTTPSPAARPADFQFPEAPSCASAAPPFGSGPRSLPPRNNLKQAGPRRTRVHSPVGEILGPP